MTAEDGDINVVASDHTPFSKDYGRSPNQCDKRPHTRPIYSLVRYSELIALACTSLEYLCMGVVTQFGS
jgi:hypothetical protein